MIRHILLINWKKDTPQSQIDAAVEKTRALRALDCIADLQCGGKLGLAADPWEFAVTVDFASIADWHAYQRDPVHAAAAALVRPLVDAYARVQIEID